MSDRERFFAIGSRVQRRTFTLRTEWQTWMSGLAGPEDGPFAVLSGMADYCECDVEADAISHAKALNDRAAARGTLQTETVVVP